MQPDGRVVIEVRDGVVEAVYAPTAKWLKVVVVNWDGEEDEKVEKYDTRPLDVMHPELRAQLKAV